MYLCQIVFMYCNLHILEQLNKKNGVRKIMGDNEVILQKLAL